VISSQVESPDGSEITAIEQIVISSQVESPDGSEITAIKGIGDSIPVRTNWN